jgi:DNA repair exonuclease SbcCD ATPase subunit
MTKEPCKYCGGPPGECTEIRGGFLPEWVCKNKPTYQQLWDKNRKLEEQLEQWKDQYCKVVESKEKMLQCAHENHSYGDEPDCSVCGLYGPTSHEAQMRQRIKKLEEALKRSNEACDIFQENSAACAEEFEKRLKAEQRVEDLEKERNKLEEFAEWLVGDSSDWSAAWEQFEEDTKDE